MIEIHGLNIYFFVPRKILSYNYVIRIYLTLTVYVNTVVRVFFVSIDSSVLPLGAKSC
jgi:hypothetical protein